MIDLKAECESRDRKRRIERLVIRVASIIALASLAICMLKGL